MAEAPSLLSSGTHMMGVLLAPPLKHTALDRIELVALDEERALAVLVTDTGWVTARPINTVPRGGSEELRETGRALTRRFRGKTFQEILDDLSAPADPLDPLWTRSRGVLDEVVALLRDRTLYLSGATNMLDHPDLSDTATLRSMLRAFEDKARLIDLLSRMAEERGIQVSETKSATSQDYVNLVVLRGESDDGPAGDMLRALLIGGRMVVENGAIPGLDIQKLKYDAARVVARLAA